MIHPEPTHGLHCQEPACVLPGCVNLKLGKMKKNIAKRTKRCGGHGKRSKLSHRGTRIKTVLSKAHITDHLWEDIQSVLRDNIEKSEGYTNRQEIKDVFFGEESSDVLDKCLGIQLRSHQPRPFHSSEKVTNQCFGEFRDTRFPFSGTKNDARQHLGHQQEETDQIVSDLELACQVPSDPLFTKDSSECACHRNKRGELENETAPFTSLLHFDDFISMETHNFVQNLHSADDQQTSSRKSPLETIEDSEVNQTILCDEISSLQRSDIGPSNKLIGTLSLLFQVFTNPMSVQLEQRCVHILEKACREMRSVQSLHSFDCSE